MPPRRTPSPVYRNPFRDARVTAERIDMGVDYAAPQGDPIYAIGPAVVLTVYPAGGGSGWPGGGWVSYRLTAGSNAGQIVYVAEDISPTVLAGQQVTSSTVVARFVAGTSGIETGWASGLGTGTLAAQQGEIPPPPTDPGLYSTEAGVTFSNLIASLGGPAGIVSPGGIRGPGGRVVRVPVTRTKPSGRPSGGQPVKGKAGAGGPAGVGLLVASMVAVVLGVAAVAGIVLAASAAWAARQVTS